MMFRSIHDRMKMPTETKMLVAYLAEHAAAQKEQIAALSQAKNNLNVIIELQNDRIRCLESEKETKVESSNPIEIKGTSKPLKPKSVALKPKSVTPKPTLKVSHSSNQMLDDDTVNGRVTQLKALACKDFGDTEARSGGSWISAAVALPNFVNQQIDVIIHKYGGTHSGGFHSVLVPNNGKSALTQIHEKDRSEHIAHLFAYKEYLLSCIRNGPLVISKNKVSVFTSKQTIRPNPAYYTNANNCNWNRNMKLEGHKLYFIDTSLKLIVFDLSKLLSVDNKQREAFAPQIIEGSFGFEEFCVDGRGNLTVLSKDGLLARVPEDTHSIDLCKQHYAQLGTQFGALETLVGYVVVGAYCHNSKQRAYTILSETLKPMAFVNTTATKSYRVQNMLLFVKQNLLHILSCAEYYEADLLVYNGNKVHLVQTMTVNGHSLCGVVWLKKDEEALILGYSGTLKSIKLM